MINYKLKLFIDQIIEEGIFKLGAFRLKLHERSPEAPLSPFYIDLRLIRSRPHLLQLVARLLGEVSKKLKFDLLADIPTAATPIVAVMSVQMNVPMVSPRLVAKTHGIVGQIDGVFESGMRVLLVDDLVTKADSKFPPIEVLEQNGLTVEDVLVLLDRQQGGGVQVAEAGYNIHSGVVISDLLEQLRGQITPDAFAVCLRYLEGGLSSGWEKEMEEGWDSIGLPT